MNDYPLKENYKKILEYTQLGKIGKGSFGTVYSVLDKNRVRLAEKVLKSEDGITEIDFLSRMKHPNIIGIEDFFFNPQFNSEGDLSIIMPYADNKILNREKIISTPTEKLFRWIHEILSVTFFIHKNGYAHCDIKPDNILLLNEKIKIADFSLSYPYNTIKSVCATYHMSDPQGINYQFDNRAVFDLNGLEKQSLNPVQTDIWGIGCIIFYLFTGKFPFGLALEEVCKNISIFAKDKRYFFRYNKIPEELFELLERMLEPDLEKRMNSLEEAFQHEVLVKRNYNIPIEGELKIYENISKIENIEAIPLLKNTLLNLIEKTVYLTIPLKSIYLGINLFYTCVECFFDLRDVKEENLFILGLACFYISSNGLNNIISFERFYKLLQKHYNIKKIRLENLFRSVIIYTKGIVNVPTIHDYTMCRKDAVEALRIMINPESYISTPLNTFVENYHPSSIEKNGEKERALTTEEIKYILTF